MSDCEFKLYINLALSNEHNACKHICCKMYYSQEDMRHEQRFDTLKYYSKKQTTVGRII